MSCKGVILFGVLIIEKKNNFKIIILIIIYLKNFIRVFFEIEKIYIKF